MQITLDTNAALTPTDRQILGILLGADVGKPIRVLTDPEAEPEATPEDKPKRTRRTKAQMEADAAALAGPPTVVEPSTADLDPDPVEVPTDGPTMADAIDRAKVLLDAGKHSAIKDALALTGAAKVTHLAPADIQGFLDALADA